MAAVPLFALLWPGGCQQVDWLPKINTVYHLQTVDMWLVHLMVLTVDVFPLSSKVSDNCW